MTRRCSAASCSSTVDSEALCAEAGYGLLPEARGNGYTRRGTAARSPSGPSPRPDFNRIALCHAVGNGASCSVARAAGYAIEGTMRQSYRFGDGELHDEHLHARLRTDPPPEPL